MKVNVRILVMLTYRVTEETKLNSTSGTTTVTIQHLHVFGCWVYAHVQKDKCSSFAPKSRKCIFLGYPDDYKGWKCWDPITGDLFISCDVHFVEMEMPGAELDLPGQRYELLSGSVGESAGPSPAPALSLPSVPSVEPGNSNSDNSDSDSGSEIDPNDPPVIPDSNSSDLDSDNNAHPFFAPSPSAFPPASPMPQPSPASLSPEPEPSASPEPELSPSPDAPSDSRDSRTPPAANQPYVTCSGCPSHPVGEWWKNHPYKHAQEQHRHTRRSGSTPESTAEAQIVALEEANSLQTLSESELIEYAFLMLGTEPESYKEAMTQDDAGLWHKASQQEYDSLLQHGVWELCELPAGCKAVACHWVYHKTNPDGSVEHYKAQLVAKGFSQKLHLDYTETFAPVAKFTSLCTVLAIAAAEDMGVHTMDVSSSFLNGSLDEEIYMAQPEGFAAPGQEHLVCHLKKSLYDLKQSPGQ
jgi:hypothetical protein